MFILINILLRKLHDAIVKIIEAYVLEKYGSRTKVCFLYSEKNTCMFKMDQAQGQATGNRNIVRYSCGQNMLMTFGLPKTDKDIPVVYLVVFPSAIRVMGIRETLKLIKDWPGQSYVATIEVVRYKLFGRK